jgi:hypothetical protein
MRGLIIDAVGILIASLMVAGAAVLLVMYRPKARRRRRRRRHAAQPRIDLSIPPTAEPPAPRDA